MTAKQKSITAVVVLAGVFLAGFGPQYLEKRRIQSELTISTQRLRMAELRDLAGMMMLEALRQNYGLARDYSTQYFEKLRETSDQANSPPVKASLQELLNSREAVTAALSNADPASVPQLQTLFAKTQAATKVQP